MSVAGQVVAAYRAGAASWDEDLDALNPYNGIGPTARERVLSVAWRQGRLSRVSPIFLVAPRRTVQD